MPALIVFVVTAGFRFMSPPGSWARYAAKSELFSAELPGRPILKRQSYDSESLGIVQEERWALQVGAGKASTEYFVLRLQLSADALQEVRAPQALDATLASALKDSPNAQATFKFQTLGHEAGRELVAQHEDGRTLTARAVLRSGAIILAGVDAAPKGATVLPKLPEGNVLQRLFAKRNSPPGKQWVVFEPEPERFLNSFEWGAPSSP